MDRSKARHVIAMVSHLAVYILGGVTVYLAIFPVSYIWGTFFGVEIHSEASFPLGHMARIYSSPGIGDQQLICVVDGQTVYRTGDFVPGNVHEKILWDESGTVATFIAAESRIFVYDTKTGVGRKE